MMSFAIPAAILLFALAMLLNLLRMFLGPAITDRILALDTLFINSIGLIVLLGIQLNTRVTFELALLIALMGFIGTVAMAKFLIRGDVIE
jgi:multicomponent K+:H+ antiporter subunit F